MRPLIQSIWSVLLARLVAVQKRGYLRRHRKRNHQKIRMQMSWWFLWPPMSSQRAEHMFGLLDWRNQANIRKIYHCELGKWEEVGRLLWFRFRGRHCMDPLPVVWCESWTRLGPKIVYRGLSTKRTEWKLATFSSSKIRYDRNRISIEILAGNMCILCVWYRL